MARSERDEITEKTIENGGILANLYLDMQSEKAEDLQPLMTDLINNRLMKAPGVVYCYGSIEEPIKIENTYSTSAKLTVLVKSFSSMISLAFNYTPVGIELLRPNKEYTIKSSDLQTILMDLAQISMDYSQYILQKVMTKEDYAKIQKNIKGREELGKKLLEKKDEKKQ
jgi:hypothetical protein